MKRPLLLVVLLLLILVPCLGSGEGGKADAMSLDCQVCQLKCQLVIGTVLDYTGCVYRCRAESHCPPRY